MEILALEGSTINNSYPYGYTCIQTMVFVKWLKNMEWSVDDIYDPLCGVIFKEEYGSWNQSTITNDINNLYVLTSQ